MLAGIQLSDGLKLEAIADGGFSLRKAMSSLLCMSCAFSASYILVMLVIDIMIWVGLNLCWDCLRDRFIKNKLGIC